MALGSVPSDCGLQSRKAPAALSGFTLECALEGHFCESSGIPENAWLISEIKVFRNIGLFWNPYDLDTENLVQSLTNMLAYKLEQISYFWLKYNYDFDDWQEILFLFSQILYSLLHWFSWEILVLGNMEKHLQIQCSKFNFLIHKARSMNMIIGRDVNHMIDF